jgi:hypothetical protein
METNTEYYTGADLTGSSGGMQVKIDDTLYVGDTKVGIGTGSPLVKLDVLDGTNMRMGFDATNADQPTMVLGRTTDGTLDNYQVQMLRSKYDATTGGYGLAFMTSNITGGRILTAAMTAATIKMFLGANGNVGIGETSPSYPLEVTGNVSNISIYSETQISATGYIDRTPWFTGTSKEALNLITNIQGKDGKINHLTLPDFARVTYQKPEREYINTSYIEEEITSYLNESYIETEKIYTDKEIFNNETNQTEIIQIETEKNVTKYKQIPIYENVTKFKIVENVTLVASEGRDLGAMITLLTESIKRLFNWNTEQDTRIKLLEDELCLMGRIAFCEVKK